MEDTTAPDSVREEATYQYNKINESLQYYRFLDILVEEFEEGDLAQRLLEKHEAKKKEGS